MEEYKLKDIPYPYNALEPYIDEQTVRLHHDKHHLAYVNGLNAALKRLEEARGRGDYTAIKAILRDVAFHGSGHVLHTLYWEGMCAHSESKELISGQFLDQVRRDYGSLESLKKELAEATKAVEGSGWGILAWEPTGKRLMTLAAENHQKLTVWGAAPLFVIDAWEHAYYLKYQNRRAEYVDNFWNIVNWAEVEKKFIAAK